jgi:hypothetical protein
MKVKRALPGFNPATVVVVAALIASVTPVSSFAAGGSSLRLAGELSGLVTDVSGKPQSGALVILLNKQEQMLQRVTTDSGGSFSFDELIPDLYSIRVTLGAFLPAVRDHLQVRAGMRSLLEVSLSRVFSSVQMVSTVPAPGGLMNDNWKWVLRSDSALRPVLRFLPNLPGAQPQLDSERSVVFSDSRALIRISAADSIRPATDPGTADLGTQFAFATSLYGGNRVQLSGNVGFTQQTGAPASAIRTTYHRETGAAIPTISVTMRQLYIPLRVGQTLLTGGSDNAMPAMRSLAVNLGDKTTVGDDLTLEYGVEVDMVSFLDRLHYFSPYAKLSKAIRRGTVDFTWTSGNARPELGLGSGSPTVDLERDLAALSVLPRVSLLSGHAKVQFGEDYELGVSQRFGSREYRIAAYREQVHNTTLTIANPNVLPFSGDVLPDVFSPSALFNIGSFGTNGYTASVTQDLGNRWSVTAMYGSVGVLALRGSGVIETAEDLRAALGATHRQAVTLRATGTVKSTGTRFMTSYQWTNQRAEMPAPIFATQPARPEPGLNVIVKQPIPIMPGLPWHIEATAEMRNMLAQGYLPITTVTGQSLLLVNTPRSIRGGLAFVF